MSTIRGSLDFALDGVGSPMGGLNRIWRWPTSAALEDFGADRPGNDDGADLSCNSSEINGLCALSQEQHRETAPCG